MSRALALSGLVVLLAATVQAGEFKLRERKKDLVYRQGRKEPDKGKIEKLDAATIAFRTADGILHVWGRSQVVRIERKRSLEEAYQQANRDAGDDPRAHFRLHEACLEAGLKKEAIRELRIAVKVAPKYLPAYQKLLETARAAGDLDMEIEIVDAAVRAKVATVPMLLRKAQVCAMFGLIESAEEPLLKALEVEPGNVETEARLAMLELALGKTGRAEARIEAMRKRDDKGHHALVALGQLEFARRKFDKAAGAFQEAVQRAASATAEVGLGVIALREGKIEVARGHFKRALDIQPGCVPALAGAGLVAARRKELAKAARLLDEAVGAAPKRARMLAARGYVAELAGKHDLALKMYEKALSLDKLNVYALTGAGRCCRKLGDLAKARERFSETLKLRPGFMAALRGMGRLELSRDASKAAEHLRAVVRSGSATPDDHVALAGALIRLKRYGEASAELARAGEGSIHARAGRGYLAYTSGSADEAIEHFEKLEEAARKTAGYEDCRRYAARAIQRIKQAESRLTWSDDFERADDPVVRKGWKEVEPPGVAIAIAGSALRIDGEPATAERMAQLSRQEEASFEGTSRFTITADAETGAEGKSFVGVFVAVPGGPRVLFGRHGSGLAAVLGPKSAAPREFPQKKIRQGRFAVGIEINRGTGVVRLLVDGRLIQKGDILVPEVTKAAHYDVGLFALPPKGRKVDCKFHAVKIVRSK